MDGWVDRETDGWMNGQRDGWMEGQMDGRMDRGMDGWMEGQRDGWMDGRTGGTTAYFQVFETRFFAAEDSSSMTELQDFFVLEFVRRN